MLPTSRRKTDLLVVEIFRNFHRVALKILLALKLEEKCTISPSYWLTWPCRYSSGMSSEFLVTDISIKFKPFHPPHTPGQPDYKPLVEGAVAQVSFSEIFCWDSNLAAVHEKVGEILVNISASTWQDIFSRGRQVMVTRRRKNEEFVSWSAMKILGLIRWHMILYDKDGLHLSNVGNDRVGSATWRHSKGDRIKHENTTQPVPSDRRRYVQSGQVSRRGREKISIMLEKLVTYVDVVSSKTAGSDT